MTRLVIWLNEPAHDPDYAEGLARELGITYLRGFGPPPKRHYLYEIRDSVETSVLEENPRIKRFEYRD